MRTPTRSARRPNADLDVVAGRLREALGQRSGRWLSREVEAAGLRRAASHSTVALYLQGTRIPRMDFLSAAARVLSVNLEWLLGADLERKGLLQRREVASSRSVTEPVYPKGLRECELEVQIAFSSTLLRFAKANRIGKRTKGRQALANRIFNHVAAGLYLLTPDQRPTGSRLTDYFVASLQALRLSVPKY